jgi:hypothetical protein
LRALGIARIAEAHVAFLDRLSQLAFPMENNLAGQGNSQRSGVGDASGDRQHNSPREDKVSDLNPRIEAIHRRDVVVAWALVVGLWCAVIFVALATWDLASNAQEHLLLLCAGAIVLLFS